MSDARTAGFTLVEVLVAFVIVALSLTVLLPIIGDNGGHAVRAQQTRHAVEIAESKLDQLGTVLPLAPGRMGGVEDGFRWQISVGAAVPARTPGPLRLASYDVVATVAWGESDGPPTVTLRTLRLGKPP